MPNPKKKLASLGLAPAKARGQNFIGDARLAAKIADLILLELIGLDDPPNLVFPPNYLDQDDIHPSFSLGYPFEKTLDEKLNESRAAKIVPETGQKAKLVEIGPGLGALTAILLARGVNLTAVEVDKGLAEALRDWPEAREKKLTVLHQDILTLDLEKDLGPGPYLVCGNIPYNISTPILFWFMAQARVCPSGIFMLQKEMAQNLTANPNSREYGRLTVAFSLWYDVRVLRRFSAASFVPRPKVDSSLVSLRLKGPPPGENERAALGRLTAAAFLARRKTIHNNLKARYGADKAQAALDKLEIDPLRRPETLEPTKLFQLSQILET
jgi:16S rRNA (adenine1518-N6/adenine1519-N6)-dimethyltransferase